MASLSPPTPVIPVGRNEIAEASRRLASWVHRTPVMTSRTLDRRCGGLVFLKCENFQRAGAFKFRGAMNALLQLEEPSRRTGVITHSSGNHAQALSLAGALLGVPVTVVMPRLAPAVKRAATAGYGARIVDCEPTLESREATVAAEAARHGLTLIHPYDDWNVIAGQGTAAFELIEEVGPLDLVVAPVGGGGLLSGTALAVSGDGAGTRVVGAEPANADDARRSLLSREIQPANDPRTVADGLRTSLGRRPFAVISRHVSQIVTASETEILDATRFVWERLKLVIEPSSAVAVAPLLSRTLAAEGLRVGVILSGGNLDLEAFFREFATRLA